MLYLKNRFEVLQFLLDGKNDIYANEIFEKLETREFEEVVRDDKRKNKKQTDTVDGAVPGIDISNDCRRL